MKHWGTILATALVISALAWAFWHFLGRDAMDVFTASVIVLLAIGNMRLRRMSK